MKSDLSSRLEEPKEHHRGEHEQIGYRNEYGELRLGMMETNQLTTIIVIEAGDSVDWSRVKKKNSNYI